MILNMAAWRYDTQIDEWELYVRGMARPVGMGSIGGKARHYAIRP